MASEQLTNTQLLLRDCISQEFVEDGSYSKESDFFEYFASSQVLKDYDLSVEEVERGIFGSGGDGGCDAIYIFVNGVLFSQDQVASLQVQRDVLIEFIVIQAKKVLSFGEDALMKWKTVNDALLPVSAKFETYKTRYNSELLEAYKLFHQIYKKSLKCRIRFCMRFYYVTLADQLHPSVVQQADELQAIIKRHYPASESEVNFVDANGLYAMYQSRPNQKSNLVLAEIPIALGVKKDFVTLVKLTNFYKFITDENCQIRRRLFDANVRDYQGRNKVNTSIQETLSTETDEDFWWLNNGITILSNNAIPISSRELQLDNPVIVNGLQTSNEIFSFYSQNPESLMKETRNILVRIIVPESEESRNKIIFATNNQTNIPKSTLRVTDPIHLEIELYFKNKGLYYDRRKNFYKNEGKKPSDIVGVSFLGQCMISIFLKKPDYARARPSTLLNDDDYYNYLYNKNHDLEVFYKCAVIGKRVNHFLGQVADYSPSERSDVLFYIVYGVVAQVLNKTDIEFEDIKKLPLEQITNAAIKKTNTYVKRKYKKAGGNGKIAKSSEFTEEIIKGVLE